MRFPRPLVAWLVVTCAVGLTWSMAISAASPRLAAAAAPAAVAARIGGQQVQAHFTNPRAHDGRDSTIHDEVVRLIDAAPPGSTIRGTIYSLTVQRVARALVA